LHSAHKFGDNQEDFPDILEHLKPGLNLDNEALEAQHNDLSTTYRPHSAKMSTLEPHNKGSLSKVEFYIDT
jgi:hypothetical protein